MLPTLDFDVVCIRCGYNLRHLSCDGKCPECGQDVLDSIEFPPIPKGAEILIARVNDQITITVLRHRLAETVMWAAVLVTLVVAAAFLMDQFSNHRVWIAIVAVLGGLVTFDRFLGFFVDRKVEYIASRTELRVKRFGLLRKQTFTFLRDQIDAIKLLALKQSKSETNEYALRIWFTDGRDAENLLESTSSDEVKWLAEALSRALQLEEL